jgi:DNA-binding response OmpR family regulator
MSANPGVLIVDDDPAHLEIYGLIVQKAGFEPVTLLVRFSGVDLFPDARIGLVLLDYRLNSIKTAPEIAQEVRAKFPHAPIILLTDLWSLPADVAPFVVQFVRKGDPAKLLEVLNAHFPASKSNDSDPDPGHKSASSISVVRLDSQASDQR